MEEDIVLEMQKKSFSARNIAEKQEIIRKGRPTPVLKNKIKTRTFQKKWYKDIDWLCGSSVTEKLYCWPCLLFKPKDNQSWTGAGYNNFKNILTECKHHSKSLNHLSSYKSLKTFGQYDILTAISEAAKLAKQIHNEEVEENRQYLKQLTNAVLYSTCASKSYLCVDMTKELIALTEELTVNYCTVLRKLTACLRRDSITKRVQNRFRESLVQFKMI